VCRNVDVRSKYSIDIKANGKSNNNPPMPNNMQTNNNSLQQKVKAAFS
jgi:hypothetical protein